MQPWWAEETCVDSTCHD